MEDIIKRGIEKGFISFNEDQSRITYLTEPQAKTYKYSDPEEKVRAVVFLQLIFDYKYPKKRIQLEVQVPRRTPNDWADIVVFNDDECLSPYIVVECKQKEVSEQEYVQAIEQGFGNANSLKAHFLLVTSGIKTLSYNVADYKSLERVANRLPNIPHFGQEEISVARFYKGGVDENGNQQEDIRVISEEELTRIFGKAHQALWAGGKRDPSEAFDELDKIIFCKIKSNVRSMNKIVGKEFLDHVLFVTCTDNEIIKTESRVILHDVPENRFSAQFNHRLWLIHAFFRNSGSETTS